MSCFSKLVSSKFIKNIGTELLQARKILDAPRQSIRKRSMYYTSKTERKKLYNYHVQNCGFKDYFNEIDPEDTDMLFALQEGTIIWLACRSKSFLDMSAANSLHLTGDIPIYTGKHYINNKLFHVLLYDLSFQVIPPTTN